MKVQSMIPGQSKKVQTVGLAAFIGAAVVFALGFILMLTSSGPLMSHQLPLILMTVAAVDICFAAALSSTEVPAAEKARLRFLSIIGAIVVVIAATLISAKFRVNAFEIVIMLVALGGAWGMYRLGEIMGARFAADEGPSKAKTVTQSAPAESPKPAEPAEATKAPKVGEAGSPSA